MRGMRGKYLPRFGTFLLAALLLPGVVLLWSQTNVEAQRRIIVVNRPVYRPLYRSYGRYSQYVFRSSGAAYDEGYHAGMKTGAGDVKHQRSYDPERSHYFQEAGFGNFGEVYRSGFVRGYAAGFRS